MSNEEPWRHSAKCSGADTELFYPPRDKTKYKKVAAQAKVFCFGQNNTSPCPVRKECLWDAIERDELHGIWGGLSHRERNALVRKWQKQYKKEMTLETFILTVDTRANGYK
jgi:WhiB family redox-sensing transcriptional regulator